MLKTAPQILDTCDQYSPKSGKFLLPIKNQGDKFLLPFQFTDTEHFLTITESRNLCIYNAVK